MTRNCNHCGKYKDETEFNWRFKSLGVRHKTCRDCMHAFNKDYFEGNAKERHLKQVSQRKHEARNVAREYVHHYLLVHPCEDCGESDPRVLEFHHVGGKDMAVSAMVSGGYPVSTIKAEIERCRVLCANCHRKLTVEERGWFKKRS